MKDIILDKVCPNCLYTKEFIDYENGIIKCKYCGIIGRGYDKIKSTVKDTIKIECEDDYSVTIRTRPYDTAKYGYVFEKSIKFSKTCLSTLINKLKNVENNKSNICTICGKNVEDDNCTMCNNCYNNVCEY